MNKEKGEREKKGSGREISHFCRSCFGDVTLGNIPFSTTVSRKVEKKDYTTACHILVQ